jgi:hypothetical protein
MILRVAHDPVGYRHFDVVTGQEASAAKPDMCDPSPFSTIESDEVPDPVRCVREDEYTGEEVGDRVLAAEADRDPDDSGRGQPPGNVQVPNQEQEVGARPQQQHVAQVAKQGQCLFIDEAEAVRLVTQGL